MVDMKQAASNGDVKKRKARLNFKDIEAVRPPLESKSSFHYTKSVCPDWRPGSGANSNGWKSHPRVTFSPYEPGRTPQDNYKLLISGIVPRPIGFISSMSSDGVPNLAPMSYTQMVNHDPPVLVVGISMGRGLEKDTLRNILETGECTVSIVSEWFVEAANYTCIDAPYGVSEWSLSGLTPAPSKVVKPACVAESPFSIECKVLLSHCYLSLLNHLSLHRASTSHHL